MSAFIEDAASSEGQWMHDLATRLFPIPRSLTGDGVRETLSILARYLPGLTMNEVPSGTEVLDWKVPPEWNVREAFLEDPSGKRIIDFSNSNLHVVGYSEPVNAYVSLAELQTRLHSDSEFRTAIPYVTSYYTSGWGFCLSQEDRERLPNGDYHAVIDSTLEQGSLTYGELLIPGETSDEVFLTTYICHPSMGNNELSGPVVLTALSRWLLGQSQRRYSYRIIFAPETIGAITYLSRNLQHLRRYVVAGINLTCIGDNGDFSFLPSRLGNTPIDRIGRRVVSRSPRPKLYTYLDRGSDERQYCMPGVDLPLISLMRTKYGAFPEYHTSLDDLNFITPSGLQGGLNLARDVIREFEESAYYRSAVLGEPQLSRRGLYHNTHARTVADTVLLRTHVLAYSDGTHSTQDIADLVGLPLAEIQKIIKELADHELLVSCAPRGNSMF